MSLYAVALFLHVLGALAMFAGLGIEWVVVEPLRRATGPATTHQVIAALRSLQRLGGPPAVAILVTGIYMAMSIGGRQAWIGLGLIGLIAMGLLGGGVTGRRVAAIMREVNAGSSMDSALMRLQEPVLAISLRLRTTIATGIIFLMTTKPNAGVAVAAMVVALAIGLVWSLPAFGRRRSAAAEQGA